MFNLIRKVLSWRFFRRDENLGEFISIIKWWEYRRIPYNLIVGATGIITLIASLLITGIASEITGDQIGFPDPPIFAIFAVLFYGIAANVCFTGGWILELIVNHIWGNRAGAFPQISFFFGVIFSIIVTLLPILFSSMVLVLSLMFWQPDEWHNKYQDKLATPENPILSPSGKYLLRIESGFDKARYWKFYIIKKDSENIMYYSRDKYSIRHTTYITWGKLDNVWVYSGDVGVFYWVHDPEHTSSWIKFRYHDAPNPNIVPEFLRERRPKSF